MKYTKEITDQLVNDYRSGVTVQILAERLQVPERSVIAKLSSLGCYQKKTYLNKLGQPPVKKSEHIDTLAQLLEVPSDHLESLEKVNKRVLELLIQKLRETGP
jgi:hypothetical protein